MTAFDPIPVLLRDDVTWRRPLSVSAISLLIMHLFNHDFRVNEKLIYPVMGIDMKTRRAQDNVPERRSRQLHQYRITNKALSMELLTALLLTYLNAASQVRTWCVTRNGLPHSFSPPKFEDVFARYPETPAKPGFRVVVEVSAKRDITRTFYQKQLQQAWRHASELAEDPEGGEVYALVINGGRIGSMDRLGEIFWDFAQEMEISPDKPVRVVPLFAGDLAAATRKIEEQLPARALQFTPGLLGGILDTLFSILAGFSSHDDSDPGWMCDLFVDMVKQEAERNRGLGLDKPPSSKGGSAEPGADPEPG